MTLTKCSKVIGLGTSRDARLLINALDVRHVGPGLWRIHHDAGEEYNIRLAFDVTPRSTIEEATLTDLNPTTGSAIPLRQEKLDLFEFLKQFQEIETRNPRQWETETCELIVQCATYQQEILIQKSPLSTHAFDQATLVAQLLRCFLVSFEISDANSYYTPHGFMSGGSNIEVMRDEGNDDYWGLQSSVTVERIRLPSSRGKDRQRSTWEQHQGFLPTLKKAIANLQRLIFRCQPQDIPCLIYSLCLLALTLSALSTPHAPFLVPVKTAAKGLGNTFETLCDLYCFSSVVFQHPLKNEVDLAAYALSVDHDPIAVKHFEALNQLWQKFDPDDEGIVLRGFHYQIDHFAHFDGYCGPPDDGRKERVQFDKITARVSRLCYGLDAEHVDAAAITQKVISGVYQGVTTIELDNLAAETAAYMTVTHPDYAILAARIAVSNLHKQTKKQFSSVVDDLFHYINPKNHKPAPMISQDTHRIVMQHAEELNSAIVYDRDFNYQYFGFKTLERSYLLRLSGKVAERPQHMIMRVAVGIHGEDIEKAIETYHLMSQKCFTHASPTLFNAGTPQPQLASCFLIDMKDDSIEGIYDTLKTCALISKTAGGVGLNIHRIRATGSYISGTNGTSNGIVPMLRVFNNTARYVDQGGNKRPGAFAMYLEPWHADVFEFLDLRKNHGKEEIRARDLFFALWIPDLFMRRVEKNGEWTLMCPNEAPGLADVYGDEFEALYEKYEKEGRGRKTIKAQKLWYSILEAQTETGNPYMLYKDACNRKSNQKNLGTIRSSNLCTEIIEYTAPDEVAVCNLASLALPTFVDSSRGEYDFGRLHEVVQVVTRNLNKIIDVNHYPVPEARNSNMRHRPIGLGVQGLADAFLALRLPFDSPEARQLNKQIFETIYHGALTSSCQTAKELGHYETYPGSPVSQGILQYDMWNVTPTNLWDWDSLKADIAKHGVRNSLLVAPMPTASTSQILGFNECFEPYTSNIYSRRVLAGEFQVVNPWLLKDLVDMGLWSDNMKNRIIADGGSIQNIPNIPADLKALYKTVWEISQRSIVQMAADRGAFIDQSQSLNIHMKDPTMGKITSMHFAGWKLGLKTGMYYLRTMAASAPIQFTVDQEQLKVADTNVARARDLTKKRVGPTGYSSSPMQTAVPRPMYVKKSSMDSPASGAVNGIPTPTATPPPVSSEESKTLVPPTKKESAVLPTFKADASEGESPKSLATDPTGGELEALKDEELPEPAIKNKERQEEDKEGTSDQREGDIYAEKVLACSIENKEACVMCSG
ncbi:MAG: hypothetical protein Q9218_006347 [Villophora microphyllina]